jgi:putative ABC transport system permease protein
MTLKEIAFRNIMRRKAKAFFVLTGLSIGVATVVAVISFSDAMTGEINHKLEKYGANILIVPKTESLSLSYGGVSMGGVSFGMEEIREEELLRLNNIRNAKNIAAAGPLVMGVTEVSGHQVLLSGIDFEAAGILKPWWNIDGKIPDENSVLLGADTANLMNLSTGDGVFIGTRKFTVSGILKQTGSQDDRLIFTTLPVAQEIHNKHGIVSMVEIAALCQGCPIPEMVRQISEVLPNARVMAIQQVVKGRMEALSQFKTFSMGISAVVVLVGSLVVLVTMMGSVRERTEEIGIFRAIGFRKSHIMKIIFIEAGIISISAGLIGYLLGEGGARAALGFFIESHEHVMPLDIHLPAGAVMMALMVGLLASFYPAFAASRMDPTRALKTI